eukprot:g3367.t1
MTLTSNAASDLLNSMEPYSFPMPPVTFAPAVWYLGAHMLKCILETSRKDKRAPKRESETKRSSSRASKNARATPTSLKGRKRSPLPIKGRTFESRLVRDNKGNLKDKERVHSGYKKPSKTRRHSGISVADVKGAETKSTKNIGLVPESAKRGPSLGRTNDSPKKPKRSLTSSASRHHHHHHQQQQQQQQPKKETVKQGTQSEAECLKRAFQTDAEENREASWSANPVYSNREMGTNDARTDRSELSLPWITMTTFTGETVTNCTKSISKRILAGVKETTMKARMQITAHPIQTQQKTGIDATSKRLLNLRSMQPPTLSGTTGEAPPSTPKRALTATDIAIQRTIERKLGKPLSEVDPASLKVISEERMQELMKKYGAGSQPSRTSIAASILCNTKRQIRDKKESPYSSTDRLSPHRESLVA